jgi:hypothetical protein
MGLFYGKIDRENDVIKKERQGHYELLHHPAAHIMISDHPFFT